MGVTRRDLFKVSVGAGVLVLSLNRSAYAAASTLDVYSASDANVTDWLTNVVKPAFESAKRGLPIERDNFPKNAGGVEAIAGPALSLQSKQKKIHRSI